MQSTITRQPGISRRWRAVVVSVAVVALALTAAITPGNPVYAANYPSWDDVVAARANEASTQAESSQLQSLIDGLQTQVDAAQAAADKAWSENEAAQDALNTGTQ